MIHELFSVCGLDKGTIVEGQLFETGEKLRVTKFDEMQRFIAEQLAPIKQMEEVDFNA